MELVIAEVTVGEFAEVTMPSVGKLTLMLSAGAASLQEAAVARLTKNLLPSMALLAAVATVVVLPMFTEACVPASASEDASKAPLPLSL